MLDGPSKPTVGSGLRGQPAQAAGPDQDTRTTDRSTEREMA